MLDDGYRGCLRILCQVGVFDLPKNALVEGSIGLGLPCQLLIADRSLVQGQGRLLLFLRCDRQIFFGRQCFFDRIFQHCRLRESGAF